MAAEGVRGACNGCWCMYWRIGPEYHKRPREKNRNAFRRIVRQGPPPGLLAFDGERAVGWCQLTPRQDLSWLNRERTLEAVDEVPVWSISCSYIRRGYRRKGVMSALIREAMKAANRAKAPAVEAYPVDGQTVLREPSRPVMPQPQNTLRKSASTGCTLSGHSTKVRKSSSG